MAHRECSQAFYIPQRLRNDDLVAHAAFPLSDIRAGKLKKAGQEEVAGHHT